MEEEEGRPIGDVVEPSFSEDNDDALYQSKKERLRQPFWKTLYKKASSFVLRNKWF